MRTLITIMTILSINATLATSLKVEGTILESLDISAISCMNSGTCIIASDETNSIQTFTLSNKIIKIKKTISLGQYEKENDIEGITNDGEFFYLTGSHSLSRKRGNYQSSRFVVFRLKLSADGELEELKELNLKKVLSTHEILKKHYKNKDNGIDIEGLAHHNGKLYFGFRSPLINSHASILEVEIHDLLHANQESAQLLTVDLKGLGIRSLEFKNNKAYIISGNSDSSTGQSYLSSFDLDFKHPIGRMKLYSEYYKPEALEIFSSEALILHDSLENGAPKLFEL